MRWLLLLTVCALASPTRAQVARVPFPVPVGETVRLTLHGDLAGATLAGRVERVGADSLFLDTGASRSGVAWSRVAAVELRGQNRVGEALGLVGGGLAGALAGFSLGPVTGEPLLSAAFVPGALIGMVAGGVLGARHGDRWRAVRSVPPPGR